MNYSRALIWKINIEVQWMNIRELKKHLAELTKKELINEISFLFKINSFSKDYLSLKFSSSIEHSILEKYKQQIKNEFYP
jgi:hypothetical protein